MNITEHARSLSPVIRMSAFELAELHKLERCRRNAIAVDQSAMERLSERGYVTQTLAGWKPTVPGLLALSRR
jgi:hypothetical protein